MKAGLFLAALATVGGGMLGGCSNGQAGGYEETSLEAQFGGPETVYGTVEYETDRTAGGDLLREFDLELYNGTPGETFEVHLDGVLLGRITVEADGEGELEFDDEKQLPFPADFPEPRAGSIVRVGPHEARLTTKG